MCKLQGVTSLVIELGVLVWAPALFSPEHERPDRLQGKADNLTRTNIDIYLPNLPL